MNDYILFMHDDVPPSGGDRSETWAAHFARLRALGAFQGGSSIGDGVCVVRERTAPDVTRHLAGYIRVRPDTPAHDVRLRFKQ